MGLDQLSNLIRQMFFHGEISVNEEVYLSNLRQKAAMEDAKDAIERVMESIAAGMPEDCYTIDMMDAYTAMGNVIGESVEDDLVNEIFSRFCMGK